MMLKTHWVDFEIFADDVSLYRTEGKRTGFVHLFEVPTGKKLTVQFFHVSEKAADAIELDTTNLTIDEVVAKISEIIQKKQKN